MDSKAVNKAIRADIWPVLKEAGFSAFTQHTAWRYAPQKIDVVNFQSLSLCLTEHDVVTTCSFAVNLGVYFPDIPNKFGINLVSARTGLLRPREYDCPVHRRLNSLLMHPAFPSPGIWYVDPSGNNLSAVIRDALNELQNVGLSWFHRFAELTEFYRTLMEDDADTNGTWDFGENPSPARCYFTGYVAAALGKPAEAVAFLEKALASQVFRNVQEQIAGDIARLGAEMEKTPSS